VARELDWQVSGDEGRRTLAVAGVVDRAHTPRLAEQLLALLPGRGARLTLDLSQVEALDGSAVALLVHAWRESTRSGGQLVIGAASEAARRSLTLYRTREDPPAPPPPPGFLEGLGNLALSLPVAARDLAQLAADTTFALGRALGRPTRRRLGAAIEQAYHIGYRALPIVALICFLVGLTLAFQSAYQLQQFGAAIFVANLTAISVIREMGPLMTAILVAGRSGSAIAAEVATMKVAEEVDALQVMGLDAIEYLAVPRLLAILVTVPVLTVGADLVGVLGGFIVGTFYLDISPIAYLNQTLDSLGPKDLLTGLTKSVVFAWGIGLIGLYYGFRVRGGAAEVGRMTTASVVASIFFIIVADCLFSVLFYIVL